MENRINVAELLKDCPQGVELDCVMYDDPVILEDVEIGDDYSIFAKTKYGEIISFTDYGTYNDMDGAKCVIFPKGKTTWEGFVPPCKFKDGDVVSLHLPTESDWIGLFKQYADGCAFTTHCYINDYGEFIVKPNRCKQHSINNVHIATEEEKEKLFQAIKDNGYTWNAETMTLEKLPKFKVGDRIKYRGGEIVYRIVQITEDSYVLDNLCSIPISIEHMYNLVPNKFDITTLKAFESRVLVRDYIDHIWSPAFWGFRAKDGYVTTFGHCNYCVPYESNEHLLGTTDDCNEFYKTWE